MTDSVWMRDADGVFAHVPKNQVDTWTPRGAQKADEPTRDTDFVWMYHDEINGTAKIPWGAREYWQGRGWVPSEPEQPRDTTKDPSLVDVEPKKATKASEDKPADTSAKKATKSSSDKQE